MVSIVSINTARLDDSGPIARAADFMLLFMLADQADMVQFFKRDDQVLPVATRKRKSWQMAEFEYCLADRWMNQCASMSDLCSESNIGRFSADINGRTANFRFELNDSDASSFATLIVMRSDIRPSDCEQILCHYLNEKRLLPELANDQ